MAMAAAIAAVGPILSWRSTTRTVVSDNSDPTDRSRRPQITTNVTPRAIVPGIDICLSTWSTFVDVRNVGDVVAINSTNTRNGMIMPKREIYEMYLAVLFTVTGERTDGASI
jgi:hypothetical protein